MSSFPLSVRQIFSILDLIRVVVLIPSVVLRFYGALSLGFGVIGTCGEITPPLDDQWIERRIVSGGFIVKRKDVLSTSGKSDECGTSSSSNSRDDLGSTSTSLFT